jgi:hypothetical protein
MANERVLDIILDPKKGDPEDLWRQLGYGGIPSNDQLRSEIEEQVLTPKKELLAQSLDQYQMCDPCICRHFILTEA